MRVRMGILAVALALSLAACSDDSKSDPDPSPSDVVFTEVTIDCPQFADAAKKITDAQAALYDGTGGAGAIDDLVTELNALKEGAPDDIKAALTDMAAAFRDAAQLLENPNPENQAQLADLSAKLSTDSQKITAYITSKCG
ncbi:hypothetical protein [Nocardioides sp.]|uniref:hypothetical protein n=1 Tax=Nocardioides sp. TaxID=35761 RepID=UPI0031FF2D84|nr:hypothetical protein [Nocardioides sp.]